MTDATGATLPGVTLTATNDATGFNRTVVTDADGTYKFLSLPPGIYTVLSDLAGFGTVTTKNVEVNVATERSLNVSLKPAAVKEQITVTAEAPLVATSPSVGTVVSQRELENLPLNGRQFANLGSLAPGTSLSVNSDPTKPGQLTIALNGGSGRNVNFLIDGGDNTDDTIGGALQNFNIEAVQEFKIQTMQYKAEYGRSSGGVLSVVTKTGTNELQGSAYEFYRAKGLNSLSESEIDNGNVKQPYRRDQYGFSLGGPIVKDRAHFFGTYEKTKRTTTYTVQTPLLPQFNGQSITLPFEDQLGTVKASGRCDAEAVPAGSLRLSEELRQVRRRSVDRSDCARNDDEQVLVVAGRPHVAGFRRQAERLHLPADRFQERHRCRLAGSVHLLPVRREQRPEPEHAAVDDSEEVAVQGRLQLLA